MKALTVIVASMLILCTAQAREIDVEEAARAALAQKRYAEVIAIYDGGTAEGLGSMARYRLAIAFQGMTQPVEAWSQLQLALEKDPKGTFASSASRLTTISDGIKAGCIAIGRPDCKPLEPQPQTVPEVVAQTPAAAVPEIAPTASAPAQITTLQPAQPAAAEPSPASAPEAQADWRQDTLPFASAGLNLAILVLLCWMFARQLANDRALPGGVRGIRRVRDDVADLLQRLEASPGGTGSELHSTLGGLLPLLEREAGRVTYRAKGQLARLVGSDREAAELVARLSAAPLDVLHSDASAVEAIFRRKII